MLQHQEVEQKLTLYNMNNLSNDLKKEAIGLGLCEQWTAEWGNPDKDELVDKYVRGIDFCIEHDYPTVECIKANFSGVMEGHGVFADNILNLLNRSIAIINGECEGVINYDGYNTGRIYIRHKSDIHIITKGNSKVFISIYDDSKVTIECSDNAKVYVYKYGGSVVFTGNVIVRNKDLHK